MSPSEPGAARPGRARRLRAPLLLLLWVLLAFEAAGGLVIFVARLILGTTPGEAAHVLAGIGLTVCYALYQRGHWTRVRPFRPQRHYVLGLIAAAAMVVTNLTGWCLAAFWWRDRHLVPIVAEVQYPPLLSGLHNVCTMIVLTFAGAHVGAVLTRAREPER